MIRVLPAQGGLTYKILTAGTDRARINAMEIIMPEFMREMVERSFQWAILADILFMIPFGILPVLLVVAFRKSAATVNRNAMLRLLQLPSYAAGVFFLFYIWSVRGHSGWLVLAIFGSVITFLMLVLTIAVLCAKSDSTVIVWNFLSECADAANKNLPRMIDEETRLDKTEVSYYKTFQYHFTLVKYAKDEFDPEKLKNALQPSVSNYVKTNDDLKELRDRKVTIEYVYHDKNNEEVLTLTYEPKDYI
jgi:hypothetical protein